MAQLVCCPCGNPLDCERLEIVVTLECPKCSRELKIEMTDPHRGRCHAILTVMEGPYWVGEQFVMPLGQDLIIGKAGGNWISLDSDDISDQHCRLKLTPRGAVQVEDLGSDSGTWIGPARIARGRLRPTESVKVGDFRLRLDLKATIGGEIISQQAVLPDTSGYLPDLRSVEKERTLLDKLAARRFVFGRNMIMAFAWLTAIYHFCTLRTNAHFQGYQALIAAVAVLTPLLIAGRRVALVHRYFKYAVIAVLALIALVDVVGWHLGMASGCAFVLAATMPLLTTQQPSHARAICGMVLGTATTICIGIMAVQSTMASIPH